MAHKNHPACPFTSKAACDQAAREAMGRCSEQTSEEKTCARWATDMIADRPYCEQHASSIVRREVEASRRAKKKAELQARIDAWLAMSKTHPSIWDRR